jgi:hypothetical protein
MNCQITYDLEPGPSPRTGEYLVSQGKHGPNSAYLIVGLRLVSRRKPSTHNRWMLTCQRVTVLELINGVRTWPLYWYPRDKKKQPVRLGGKMR